MSQRCEFQSLPVYLCGCAASPLSGILTQVNKRAFSITSAMSFSSSFSQSELCPALSLAIPWVQFLHFYLYVSMLVLNWEKEACAGAGFCANLAGCQICQLLHTHCLFMGSPAAPLLCFQHLPRLQLPSPPSKQPARHSAACKQSGRGWLRIK